MDRIQQLIEERRKLIADARVLAQKAEGESRDLTAEERQHFDEMIKRQDEIKGEADRLTRLRDAESDLETRTTEPVRPEPEGDPEGRSEQTEIERRVDERLRERGLAVIQGGLPDHIEAYNAVAQRGGPGAPEYRSAFRQAVIAGQRAGLSEAEVRALQADVAASGGELVAPIQFQRDLIQGVDDMVYLRQWGTVRTVANANSVGYPSLDTDPADSDWTSELATGSEDSSMAFGGRELHPHPLAKRIKVSDKLLRLDSSAEGLVRSRLAYKFGVTMEKAGLTGTGSGQPLGVFTASAGGISTGRDVATGNTTTSPTFDGLINAKYALKGNYWPRARWLFHRDILKLVALLKDGNGQYLWRESTRAGEPDRVLNLPVFMSEFAPNTATTGLYVGMLADFSNYWWADALGMRMTRLNELYAETNQIGFIGRLESDGMPVLEEAFVRVKLA